MPASFYKLWQVKKSSQKCSKNNYLPTKITTTIPGMIKIELLMPSWYGPFGSLNSTIFTNHKQLITIILLTYGNTKTYVSHDNHYLQFVL